MEISARTLGGDNVGFSNVSSLTDGSVVDRREAEKKSIIQLSQLLLSVDCNKPHVTVMCVFGRDGIGKTTMAQLIYTHKRVRSAFNTRIFIGMFEEKFDEKRLMKAMIESLTHAPCDITESSILEDILKDELMGKRLLLVLDGAVNEKKSFWDNLLVLLNVVAKGSAVMVITRRKEVAAVTGAIHCYKLDYLSDDKCWFIFQQLAFNGTDPNAKPELVNIGKRLITKCERNILCIKLLGGLLSYFFTEEGWRSVLVLLESDLWDVDKSGRKMLPVLRVCYDFLPSHLKQCFAYSSLFPKGYIFSKNHLVCLWLSQDFIEPVPGREFEDIGLEYFEELCCRHFFHHAKDDYFTMHELIHDLAQYISRNRHFRSEGYVHIIPKDVHHFSLVPTEHQTVKCNPMIEEARDLQSFLVINRSNFQQDSSAISPVLNLEDLNDLFLKFSSLRTLDLSDTDIEELPDSFKLLRNMHYLNLRNTKIRSLPSAIDNLVNLHTLAAEDCYNLVELPKSIGSLIKLRYLNVGKSAGFVCMPAGIGKLTALRSLAAFYVGSDENHCGIEELKHLENLKGSLQISGLENVKTSKDAKEANLKSKCFLENLSLNWSDDTVFKEDDADTQFHENLLENLEPNSNLQELNIRNYVGCKFPSWIGDQFLPKLVSVIFDSCVNVLELPALGALPLLRYLSMQKLYEVETMEIAKFPSLEILNLWEMYDLKEWPEIKNGDFPRLRSLSINKCPMLKSIPCLPSLEELSIYHCPQLLKIPNLSSLKFLKIEGLQKIECLDLPQGLIALKKLEISHCGELVSLNGLQKLTSIEELKIIQCPKLDVGDWQPNLSSKLDFEEAFYTHDKDIICKYGDKQVYDNKEEDTIMQREQVHCLPSFSMVMPVNFQQSMAEVPVDPLSGKVVQEEDFHCGPSRSPRSLDRQAEMQLISTKPGPSLYRLVFKNPPHIPIYYGSKIKDTDGSPLQILLVAADSFVSSSFPSPIKIELVVLDGDFPSNDDWTSDEFNKAVVKVQSGERPLLAGDVNGIIMSNGYARTGDLQFTYDPSLIKSFHFRIGARVVPGSCEEGLIKEAVTEKFIVRDQKLKGPRDIHVCLSDHTTIQSSDVQDRLAYDPPIKAVDWLTKNPNDAINKLPELPAWTPSTTCVSISSAGATFANPLENLKSDPDTIYILQDEELFTSMLEEPEIPIGEEEPEEDDVFSTELELEESSDPNQPEGITNLELVKDDLSYLGFNSNNKVNQFGIDGTVDGEQHPYGEYPSRTLFVRNINSNVEDSELKSMFEQYGDIRTFYTATKQRGFVMISYYDIRDARNAMRGLQNKPLRRRKLDIHFSILKDNPSEKDLNQGTLVIFNLDPSVSNEELKQIFGTYGEVKEIRHKRHQNQKYIEFYDVRDAAAALRALNKSEIAGKQIKLELSYPSGSGRNSMKQLTHDMDTDDARVYKHLVSSPIGNSPGVSAFNNPRETNPLQSEYSKSPSGSNLINKMSLSGHTLSSHSFPEHTTNKRATHDSSLTGPHFLWGSPKTYSKQTPHQYHVGSTPAFETHKRFFLESPNSIFINRNNNMNDNIMSSMGERDPLRVMMMGEQGRVRPGYFGSSLSTSPYGGGSLGFMSGLGLESLMEERRRMEIIPSQVDSRNQYQVNLDKIVNGEDTRTTLMIKNIPNKYTSKMMLSAIDEEHKGTYDFFYLPIDFKNKCNVGYAFINMSSPSHIISFYEAFNGKKWEKFTSEKVASLAYGRIQGRIALISHFQNSSLMNEDKRCPPILFHSEGPEAGKREPFPYDGINMSLQDESEAFQDWA